jgi:outer membrane protein insertion porin family
MKPRRGLRSNLDLEVAGIGGDFDFGKLTYINVYYASLWRYGIMKYRYDLKYILPFGRSSAADDIPLSERFFLGGENSVRGYKAFTLGPKFGTNEPKGGITSALLSAEYLQEIIPMIDAFLFADAGSISLHKLGIAELRMSVGGGLRLELINRVPVIIGYGIPLNVRKADKGDVQHFYITMGGQF